MTPPPDGHAFGGSGAWKIDVLGLFAEALKGTEAAVPSRHSNAHGVVSIDHPFECPGGPALAVRHHEGRTPDLVISDLRNPRDTGRAGHATCLIPGGCHVPSPAGRIDGGVVRGR